MTKKLPFKNYFLLLLFFFVGFSTTLDAQPISQDTVVLAVNNANSAGGQTVQVDITVENFVDISGGQFSVVWDSNVLAFDTVAIFGFSPGEFNFNLVTPEALGIVFTNIPGVTLADGSVLLTLTFDVVGNGVSPVSIVDSPVAIEIASLFGILPYEIINGEVNGEGAWVNGQLFLDKDQDCSNSTGDTGLSDWIIRLEDTQAEITYYGTTDENGYYSIFAALGNYLVTTTPEEGLWELCEDYIEVELMTLSSTTDVDLFAKVDGTFIEGRVFNDSNENCVDDGEDGFSEWVVKIEGDETYFVSTDTDGNYGTLIPEGSYDISVISSLYWVSCESIVPVNVDDSGNTINIDFPEKAEIICPQMEVDVSTAFLRRCFTNYYQIKYCNRGTEDAEDVYVELSIDEFMVMDSTSVPYTVMDDVYTFQVGDVAVGDCGYISFSTLLDPNCDQTELGQTHCVEAHIYPDSICLPTNANWSGASIKVSGDCVDGEVIFSIENIGDGDMDMAEEYIVVEDAIMFKNESFQLESGKTTDPIIYTGNGSTYRLQAQQVEGHPGLSMPTVVVEGCGVDQNGEFSTGYVTMYPEDDGDFFVDIDCQESIGSFDPNDKQVFPKGVDADHKILANTNLEYLIRFQNTGTDTAFTVTVRDTISELLNLATIRPGASSHPYDFEIYDGNVLKFTFENIMLPDSNVNEAASHGFFKFQIEQERDLPLGSVIENSAAIYFDFNEPVITNTSWLTIGTFTTSTEEIFLAGASVRIFPNPALDQVTIQIEGTNFNEYQLQVYDVTGQRIRTEQFNSAMIQFYRQGLTTGLYFYEIAGDGIPISSGKFILK